MNKETLRMQMLAGIITETQYKDFVLILEDETIEEGLRNWIIKGLIALTTLGGIGKVYQMDQQAKADQKNKIEYYNNVLGKEVTKMDKDNLASIGADINSKTKDLSLSGKDTSEELNVIFSNYAQKYMKSHPDEFAVGANGGVYWIKSQLNK
jgi:hypothetical protein